MSLKAVVTDIEGTTTPVTFVHDVLFPYARERLAAFVAKNANDPAVAAALAGTRAIEDAPTLDTDATVAVLLRWIAEDRKATPLKTLQGLIWREAYESGAVTAPIYADVKPALTQWRDRGLKLYVYSSGSEEAQRLLFRHSSEGDLTPFFSGYFDTRIGSKVESGSYSRIAEAIRLRPWDILFLSDLKREIAAAREAQLEAVRIDRDRAPDFDTTEADGTRAAGSFTPIAFGGTG